MTKKKNTLKTPSDEPNLEIGFEASVEQVEALIDKIEQGEIGLEESVEAYEKGVALIKRCRGILDHAEQRITELTDSGDSGGSPDQVDA